MATYNFKPGYLGYAILLRAVPGCLGAGFALHHLYLYGGMCLVLAVWADVAVGCLARRMQWRNDLSQLHLEGLVDFLCFVVAPAIFCLTLNSSPTVLLPSLIFLFSGLYRIARFNVEGLNGKGGYTGLPVTYNGYWFPLTALLLEKVQLLAPDLVWGMVLLLISFSMVTRRLSIPEL